MWDLEFTERKPLDESTEEELAASGDKAFTNLYQCLLAYSADHQQQLIDRDGASVVNLISPHAKIQHIIVCAEMSSNMCECSSKNNLSSRVKLQSIWATLGKNHVSVKSLVAVLSSFILAGKAKVANVQQRVHSLHAASIYLLLLGIPGEQMRSVPHSIYTIFILFAHLS